MKFFNLNNKKCGGQKGFTLIELLVVIAIIGILSSVVLASLNSARLKARNTQRISDLTQIRKALEMYYSDNGTYPVSSTIYATECTRTGESAYKVTNQNMIPSLVPLYISKIPTDPSFVAGSGNNCYYYRSNGTDYAFFNVYVNDSGMDYKNYPAFYDPNRDGGANTSIIDGTTPTSWKVYTPGGASW